VVRFLIRLVVFFAAAAIGLLVASAVLDGFSMSALGFIEVAAIYAIVLGLLTPLMQQQAERSRSAMFSGGVGILAVLASLVITDLISDDLTISGVGTWIGAIIIIWIATFLAGLILSWLLVKRFIDNRQERRAS
jgi:MFS family permease